MSNLNVLYAFDNNYAPFAGVSILSLLSNNTDIDTIRVYAVMDNVSDENKDKLVRTINKYSRELITVDASEINKLLMELGVPKYRGSYSTHYRKFFHLYLPKDIDRILYIDSDSIVPGSLFELTQKDFEGKCVMASLDTLGGRYKRLLGYQPGEHYYNAGVSYFDVKAWGERGYADKLINHILNVRAKYCNPDQDLFNLVVKGDALTIGPEYNFQPAHRVYDDKTFFMVYPRTGYYTEVEVEHARQNPVILHAYRYMGEFPWHKGNVHPDTPLFDEYLAKSEWKDYEKKPSGQGTMFKIEKWLYKHMWRKGFLVIFSWALYLSFYRKNKKLLKESRK